MGHEDSCTLLFLEPSSTCCTAVFLAPHAQFLTDHEKRCVVYPSLQSFCSFAAADWEFELLVAEQTWVISKLHPAV